MIKKIALASLITIANAAASNFALAEGENTAQQLVQNTQTTANAVLTAPNGIGVVNANTAQPTLNQATQLNGTNANTTIAQNAATPVDITAQNMATNPYANPNSVATNALPTNNQLVTANQELLTNNVALQRQVNDLETQVNVLVNERSGQLFMYGALTAIAGLVLGLICAWLLFGIGRRERW